MGMMNRGCGNAYMPRLAPHLLGVINIWEYFLIVRNTLLIFWNTLFIFGNTSLIFGNTLLIFG